MSFIFLTCEIIIRDIVAKRQDGQKLFKYKYI